MSRRSVSRSIVLTLVGGLAACSADENQSAASAVPAKDSGEAIYGENCVPCHREDGKGVPTVYPSLSQSPVVNGDPAELARWVLAGKRPASMPAGRYSAQMLQFGWMKDSQAAALLTYLRSHFENSSPPVDAATVAAARR